MQASRYVHVSNASTIPKVNSRAIVKLGSGVDVKTVIRIRPRADDASRLIQRRAYRGRWKDINGAGIQTLLLSRTGGTKVSDAKAGHLKRRSSTMSADSRADVAMRCEVASCDHRDERSGLCPCARVRVHGRRSVQSLSAAQPGRAGRTIIRGRVAFIFDLYELCSLIMHFPYSQMVPKPTLAIDGIGRSLYAS